MAGEPIQLSFDHMDHDVTPEHCLREVLSKADEIENVVILYSTKDGHELRNANTADPREVSWLIIRALFDLMRGD